VVFTFTATVDGLAVPEFSVVEEVLSQVGAAEVAFADWFDETLLDREPSEPLGELPRVEYFFSVETGGRVVTSPPLAYADDLKAVLKHEASGEPGRAVPYRLILPWGFLDAHSDEEGRIEHTGLPPGGATILARNFRLVLSSE
jgi:hypothetical protein